MEIEIKGKLAALVQQLAEKLQENPAFQKLRAKIDELDPQSRLYLNGAIATTAVLATLGVIWGSYSAAQRARSDYQEKLALTEMIQNASVELRQLREKNAGAGGTRSDVPAPWPPYLESQALQLGIIKESLTLGPEREGKSSEQNKESLIDLQLKKINIKQLARFAAALERGSRPVKIRALTIDTHPDASGYLDATLALSAFNPKP
jgi:hypothetical protein